MWTDAFCRNVSEDNVNDCRDIGFSKWGVINFFHIVFTVQIITRISYTLTLCTRWMLHGSPGGRGHLFSWTAHGSSFYTTCRLGGNWHHQMNAHVLLSGPFLHSWHIPCLLPNSKNQISLLFSQAKFTSPIPNWKHTLSAVHVWTLPVLTNISA